MKTVRAKRRVPSQREWHDFLDALRATAAAQAQRLRVLAGEGRVEREPSTKDEPLLFTGLSGQVARQRPEPAKAQPVQAASAHGAARNASCPCGSGRKFKHCCRGKAPR